MSNLNKVNTNFSNGYVKKGKQYIKGSNKIFIGLIGIILLVVIGMVVYWIYKAISKSRSGDIENPILVSDSIDASDKKNSKSWSLPVSSGYSSPNMSFTLSFWIYIADWYYRVDQPKALMIKGVKRNGNVTGRDAAPGFWLAPNKNNLIVATRIIGQEEPQLCNVANIPIQKWVHVAYVLDNRTVDVYVDCKLERSCVLKGVPLLNNNKLHLFPKGIDGQTGFLGQMASLRYFSDALRPVDVARLCNEGPNATKGEYSQGENGESGDDEKECSSGVYTNLHGIKQQLVDITNEVDNALENRNEQEEKKEDGSMWDIRVQGRNPPVITKIDNEEDGENGENGDNVGNGWTCNSQDGSCHQKGHIGTQGVYEDSTTCNENCEVSKEEFGNYGLV